MGSKSYHRYTMPLLYHLRHHHFLEIFLRLVKKFTLIPGPTAEGCLPLTIAMQLVLLLFFTRTYDGSCNNKRSPKWGMRGTPLVRILKNAYADGESNWVLIIPVSFYD